MSFIKNYWWVFALILGAFLLWYFLFRPSYAPTTTTNNLPPKLNPNCPLSVQEWMDKVAAEENKIRTTPDYIAYVRTLVGAGKQYATEAEAVTGVAKWSVVNNYNQCDPTKAPTA